MPTFIHIKKTETDTKRLTFSISSKLFPTGVNISSWTNFVLNIDPQEFPPNNLNNVGNLTGTILSATEGKVGFIPPGTIANGNYYYNASAIDDNGEKVTFANGPYTIVQNI